MSRFRHILGRKVPRKTRARPHAHRRGILKTFLPNIWLYATTQWISGAWTVTENSASYMNENLWINSIFVIGSKEWSAPPKSEFWPPLILLTSRWDFEHPSGHQDNQSSSNDPVKKVLDQLGGPGNDPPADIADHDNADLIHLGRHERHLLTEERGQIRRGEEPRPLVGRRLQGLRLNTIDFPKIFLRIFPSFEKCLNFWFPYWKSLWDRFPKTQLNCTLMIFPRF